MFSLSLIRHGESEANVRHMLSGWLDVDLTDKGRKELQELRDMGCYPESEAYFSSPLRRCIETCGILFPDAVSAISDDYKEINFRSMEGYVLKGRAELDSYFKAWIRDEVRIDEETMSEAMARGRNAVLDTVRGCEGRGLHSASIVMHSGIMRSALIALFSMDRKRFMEISVPNGLGYVLAFDGLAPVSCHPLERKPV